MYVIVNGGLIVSSISDEGIIRYVYGERKPKLFASILEATEWWDDNAPTLPRVGESNIRVISV